MLPWGDRSHTLRSGGPHGPSSNLESCQPAKRRPSGGKPRASMDGHAGHRETYSHRAGKTCHAAVASSSGLPGACGFFLDLESGLHEVAGTKATVFASRCRPLRVQRRRPEHRVELIVSKQQPSSRASWLCNVCGCVPTACRRVTPLEPNQNRWGRNRSRMLPRARRPENALALPPAAPDRSRRPRAREARWAPVALRH